MKNMFNTHKVLFCKRLKQDSYTISFVNILITMIMIVLVGYVFCMTYRECQIIETIVILITNHSVAKYIQMI